MCAKYEQKLIFLYQDLWLRDSFRQSNFFDQDKKKLAILAITFFLFQEKHILVSHIYLTQNFCFCKEITEVRLIVINLTFFLFQEKHILVSSSFNQPQYVHLIEFYTIQASIVFYQACK